MDPITRQALDWYVHLARQPGWKDQALHSVRALAKEHPAFFWKLPDLLVTEMQKP